MFFVATLLFLYKKVFEGSSIDEIGSFYKSSVNLTSLLYIVLAFLLMFINWGFEAFKWKEVLKETHKISFSNSLKAIFSGNSTGIFTPNRLGAFLGRVLHLPKGLRAEGILTTWVGNAAQLVATLIFGTLGAIVFCLEEGYKSNIDTYYKLFDDSILIFSITITAIALIGYFFSGTFITWFSKINFLSKHLDKLEKINTFSSKQLAYYLVLSILRYLVFVLQFYVLFIAFQIDLSLYDVLIYVGVLYITIAFMPTFLGKLGVRESVLVLLLTHLPYTEIQIVSASFTLWMINTIFPAILGAFFITKLKDR